MEKIVYDSRMAKLIQEKKVEAVESEKKNIGKLYKLPI
jgi:hypothetical protein